jgi:hypothetical protein
MARKLAAFTDIQFGLAVGGMNVKIQEAELRARPDSLFQKKSIRFFLSFF